MRLYYCLDILATITEALAFYLMTVCFCGTARFQKAVSRAIPPVILMGFTIAATYLTELGAVKIFGSVIIMIAAVKSAYIISVHESIVIMELSYLLGTILPESVAVEWMHLVYNGDIVEMVGEQLMMKWQIYLAVILVRCVFNAVLYRLFHHFSYRLHPKDVMVLSTFFLLAFIVSFANIYGFLNLDIAYMYPLDLIIIALCGCFVVQFLYSRNVSWLREQEQQNQMELARLQQQFAYYQQKMKDEERVRAIYHDLKNHLLILESGHNTEETRRMAQKLRSQIAGYENYVHTGNEFLDIILQDKARIAKEKQIDFAAAVSFEDGAFMEPLDISTIFGNALDNAIEASEKLPPECRLISVKTGRVRDMLVILVRNNTAADLLPPERTGKQDAFVHGFGLPNLKKTAERYGGHCSIKAEDGVFTLKILIPIP